MLAAYRLVSLLLLLGVGVEFFLAGATAFGATSSHGHRIVGFALFAGAVLTFVLAVAARRNVRVALAVVAVVVLQVVLGNAGMHHPWVGAIHGLGAGLVAAAVSVNARRSRMPGRLGS